ncbi:uncharacterized protein LOC119077495 [Bradysia coprophila]|uniref:uncharacterized protein LOC119077495 n=1 Tax=Bradysia coprophila TaxID=38358 RepID=UPI00187DA551|nr:uncharacterized protein LOC119077495 [Bradysia coprophila]
MNLNCCALASILVREELESSHPVIFTFAIFTDKIVMHQETELATISPANVDQIENQTDDTLPIEMTNATGTYLQDLNEYCLIDIFSSSSLRLVDLCNLAETCKEFKRITHRVFPQSLSIKTPTLFIDGHESVRKNLSKSYTVQEYDRILKVFGSRLSKLSLNDTNQAVVDSVARYCGDVKLKRLKLDGMKSIQSVCRKLKSNFQRLQILYVRFCDVTGCTTLDFNCDSLTELDISQSTGCAPILMANFPNLKQFRFNYNPKYFTNEDLTSAVSAFIGRHRHLRTLILDGMSICRSSELVNAIGDSSELEELFLECIEVPDISFIASNRLCLSKVRKVHINILFENYNLSVALLEAVTLLKTVIMHFHDERLVEVFDVLSQRQHLRELYLFCYSFDRLPWSKLTQLRKLLLFTQEFRVADILNVIKQLTNLEELYIAPWSNGNHMTEEGFTKIVKVVEGRSNVLTLTCRFNFPVTKHCNKNRYVRLINTM